MDIESLKSVIDAYLYSSNWESILDEYYKYYDEIEPYLPKEFAEHFGNNEHYHDWLLNDILIHNCNQGHTKPLLEIKLSKKSSCISLRFEGVSAIHIDGDLSHVYTGHVDVILICAFLRQGAASTFHCVFSQGIKVLVTYKKLVWSICENEGIEHK